MTAFNLDGVSDEGRDEIDAYVEARTKLSGRENNVAQLQRVVIAADKMLDRAAKLLPYVQVMASLGDGNILIGSDEGVGVYPVRVEDLVVKAQEALS